MYLIFDIGGTKMRLAVSEDGESFNDPLIVPTPQDFNEGMSVFRNSFTQIAAGRNMDMAAGGIAGALDKERAVLLKAPHLSGWSGKNIRSSIMENTGLETHVENDTAMVGLGEATYGAGKDFDIVAYLTISTGVGGARIVDRKIDANVFGFEPGHQIIDADGTMCPDCRAFEDGKSLGHLEAHISGTAVERRYGKHPKDIEDEKVWDDLAKYLAYGLNNTIVHWSPEVVILGGGMMKSKGIKIEKVNNYLEEILNIFPERPLITNAQLEDVGGLYGSLSYIKYLQR